MHCFELEDFQSQTYRDDWIATDSSISGAVEAGESLRGETYFHAPADAEGFVPRFVCGSAGPATINLG